MYYDIAYCILIPYFHLTYFHVPMSVLFLPNTIGPSLSVDVVLILSSLELQIKYNLTFDGHEKILSHTLIYSASNETISLGSQTMCPIQGFRYIRRGGSGVSHIQAQIDLYCTAFASNKSVNNSVQTLCRNECTINWLIKRISTTKFWDCVGMHSVVGN